VVAAVAGDTRSCVSLGDASLTALAFTFELRDGSRRSMALPRLNAQWCCDRIKRSLFECRPAELAPGGRYRWSTDRHHARKLTWSGIYRARKLAAMAQDACNSINTARYSLDGHPDGIVGPDDNTEVN